ncbi:MAG: 50S ribosome-binding GTPase, partial [Halobacteriovoraceae bacterium]|nr:50S ribosome-binding GTPase [Halobacteriovoraceae bacterium]
MNFNEGPIVAISTSTSSKAALGIIRVSGFGSLDWLLELTGKPSKKKIQPRYAYFSKFKNDKGDLLDEGLFTYFEGPKSFTGENLVEFSLHGNPLLLNSFCEYLQSKFGFSYAKPGEFSFRALKNKKLNMTQVEGLDLILNANSSFGLRAGSQGLSNELYKSYLNLRNEFLEIRSCIELLIDFAEDVGEEEIHQKLDRHRNEFRKYIENLKSRTKGNLSHLLTPQISLVGATNAGKSTLFNKLLKRDRAIVSDVHGTTRDFIS